MIGKGSYGHIYKAYASAQNKQYAVKIISSDCSP
jgi:serine/threonine protein kinase